MKISWKNTIWKYATAFVVVLILLNPEMIELALFIDAVGLEVFLMLLEIQLIAILGGLFNTKVKPLFVYLKCLCAQNGLLFLCGMIKKGPEYLKLLVPGQATLMYMLVLSSAISFAFNTC